MAVPPLPPCHIEVEGMENSLLRLSLHMEISTLISSLGSLEVIILLVESGWRTLAGKNQKPQLFPLVWGAGDSRELAQSGQRQNRLKIGGLEGAGSRAGLWLVLNSAPSAICSALGMGIASKPPGMLPEQFGSKALPNLPFILMLHKAPTASYRVTFPPAGPHHHSAFPPSQM